ncbi:biotin-requiring enzyme [Leptospira ryugenii]|uniref:Biotin-requiring enzyme n=1 Tax=Leptospira ryugenii TaxID=1917863 RepID=A0A2P2E021_9LEPT|nr:acetyl-CoA carboxylase biotin carboxyl carrier protein subunit [Leptospira ryugenii]GBF50222.1 biotin-requiring enzyme [Leptospira ryugenii]
MKVSFQFLENIVNVSTFENFVQIQSNGKNETLALPKIKSVKKLPAFSGQVVFADDSVLTYLLEREKVFIHYDGETWTFLRKEREISGEESQNPEIRSPMPGKIIQLQAEMGKSFQKGEVLLVLEAMKMENAILAPYACQVNQVLVALGEIVKQDASLVILDKISQEKT